MRRDDLIYYYKCNMTRGQHIAAYILCSILGSIVSFLFYHLIILSTIVGFLIGIPLERLYAESTVIRRQKKLLMQFRDFLEDMSVAANAGNVEYKALQFTADSLQISYNKDADIVRETLYILQEYEKGGRQLKELFKDFGDRSGLEDIKNFATIYEVIEGRSDNFGEIISQTRTIIADKIEIEQEIETVITGAKNETYVMLFMPIIIVITLSLMGEGFMDSLFLTMTGHVVATIALIIFTLSFWIAIRSTNIEV